MATVKLQNGNVVTKGGKISCSCCEVVPIEVPLFIDRIGLNVRDCVWDECGFLDPEREKCDETYYATETTVRVFNVGTDPSGDVETVTKTASRDEFGICNTTTDVDCQINEYEGRLPFGPSCAGLYTSTTTFTNPLTVNPVQAPYYDEELGGFVGYGPCEEASEEYPPYRYRGPNFTYWQDPCFTQPYPTHNSDGTFSEEDYPPRWSFGTTAVNFDLTSNLCYFGFNQTSRKTNIQYRLRHHPTSTCYLKVWLRVSTQAQELVGANPATTGDPDCCKVLVSSGDPVREIIIYEWEASEEECVQGESCDNFIYSPNYELIAGMNEVKTVSVYKYSAIRGYEPPDPS
jgi:hypothetical protein